MKFKDLNLNEKILENLSKHGYEEPTPIQEKEVGGQAVLGRQDSLTTPWVTERNYLNFSDPSRGESGVRKTIDRSNSLAHITTWLRSDLELFY